MKEELKQKIYFLENNTELKIISKSIPHTKIYVLNQQGKIIVKEESDIIQKSNVNVTTKKCWMM